MLTRPALFLSAYAPLFVILAVRLDGLALRLSCAGLAAVGLLAYRWVFVQHSSEEVDTYLPSVVEDDGAAIAGYLATYLLPFVLLPQPTKQDLIAYVLFFLLLGLLHARTRLAQVNPLLYLMGKRLARISTKEGFDGYLIYRGHLPVVGEPLRAHHVTDDILTIADG